ncbi:MAG: response regulator [Gammaproteobacteria bacterium]
MTTEIRILIVEDVAMDADLIERELRNANIAFTAECVKRKEAFVSALRDFMPDIILSDYNLPQFNALDAIALVKGQQADVPLILVTGSLTEEVAVMCMKEGAFDYILKSSLKRLPSAVMNALSHRDAARKGAKAAESLRKSEERFRLVSRATNDTVWDWDLVANKIWWSDAFQPMFGYSPEETGNDFQFRNERVHPDDLERVTHGIHDLIYNGGQTWSGEYRFRRADGSYAFIVDRAYVVRNDQAEPVRVLGSMMDVTARKAAEDRIQAMSTKDEEFLQRLRATFKVEADEHLQALSTGLLELEKTPAPDARRKIVETVFRAAHSLKGAARAVGFTEVESLCQSVEDVFAAWKRGESAPSPDALDTLHRTLDAITSTLAAPAGSPGTGAQLDLSSLRQALRRLGGSAASSQYQGTSAAAPPAELAPVAPPAAEQTVPEVTVRVAVAKLEARLLEAEEMLTTKLTAGQRAADLRELGGRFEAWRKAWAVVEPEARRLRQSRDPSSAQGEHHAPPRLMRLLDFFDWSMDYFKAVEHRTATLGRATEQESYAVGKLVDDLLEGSKKLLLLPFATVSASFPKMVRELCRDEGKEADLTILGEDVEIDKRILEEMKDPLTHLLRNSIDHGVEPPGERTRRGKPARATITLAVSQVNGSKVQLLVSDDGAGIDTTKVKESAVKHGIISAEEAVRLAEPEAQALIFGSEVSTSPIITQLSGRGLGLAIVREKAEKLGGEVSVESRLGLGTAFCVIVPAMRATFRGILVEAAGRLLVVPTAQVERVGRARPEDIKTVEGCETISFDGRAVALVQLADALELPPVQRKDKPCGGAPVIIAGSGDQRVAFAVDTVVDEQEVLVKPLRKPLSRVRNIAAATVLGSGQVVPILNVADLFRSARKIAGSAARMAVAATAQQGETKRILVVEDSITSRMLLKTIVESAGYNVKTAVDGMEGFMLLRAEAFDLLVSDVEMPRLNGFDLTARIRADQKLAELPVVLVTALETREDRERGIDVGANAYIVKGSFDQSNLLEAIQRLI